MKGERGRGTRSNNSGGTRKHGQTHTHQPSTHKRRQRHPCLGTGLELGRYHLRPSLTSQLGAHYAWMDSNTDESWGWDH
jgi:hypothetical protein